MPLGFIRTVWIGEPGSLAGPMRSVRNTLWQPPRVLMLGTDLPCTLSYLLSVRAPCWVLAAPPRWWDLTCPCCQGRSGFFGLQRWPASLASKSDISCFLQTADVGQGTGGQHDETVAAGPPSRGPKS